MKFRTKSTLATFETLKTQLDQYQKVFYTRFGDGEIIAMMGIDHRNYATSEGLVRELKEAFVIDHPCYLIALSVNYPFEKGMTVGLFAPFKMNNEHYEFLLNNNLIVHDEYESFITFHYLTVFRSSLMYDFFEQYIRPKKKMFIGSTPKAIAEKVYGKIDYYVEVPAQNAYNSIDKWWPEIEKNVHNVELVIPSAGAASNVISKRLWYKDVNVHLLDVGSIVDAVNGRRTRGWIKLKGHKAQKVLPEQYRDRSFKMLFKATSGELRYLFRRFIKYRKYPQSL